ncbi:hypothetical protein F4808DRAFT_467336 [Astrocystis sublimbata]|nr:hypothetical protein F4808DRAFT_467336 [Astrocystis sublimbata]
MAGAYLPPFRRQQAAGVSDNAPRDDHQREPGPKLYRPRDIDGYFWEDMPCTDVSQSARTTTFHNSKARPEQLSHMTLFRDANPRWAGDHIVFAKSNLSLLPGYAEKMAEVGGWEWVTGGEETTTKLGAAAVGDKPEDDDDEDGAIVAHDVENLAGPSQGLPDLSPEQHTDIRLALTKAIYAFNEHPNDINYRDIAPISYIPANPQAPIAVFEEHDTMGGVFAFIGWFTISRISILAPHSKELVRMLGQKWGERGHRGQRYASAWEASVAVVWAVVGFERLEGEGAPPPPEIRKVPELGGRSVNKMLAEMRMDRGVED